MNEPKASRVEQLNIRNKLNPNWQEANQLAVYKRSRGVELGTAVKQLHVVVRTGLN